MDNVSHSFSDFLQDVSASTPKNYIWLRFLSYLEYIGYRKMVKALDYQEVHKGVFHHLTDEIQHSFILKELAEKSYTYAFPNRSFLGLLKEISEEYFQDIDRETHEWVKSRLGAENPFLCYIFVSYIVEQRAMKVYPQYFSVLGEAPSKYVIQKIIRDESEHLSYLEDKLQTMPEFKSFKESHLLDHEGKCFDRLIGQMRSCMTQAESNAA